jgi:hypothetical protein
MKSAQGGVWVNRHLKGWTVTIVCALVIGCSGPAIVDDGFLASAENGDPDLRGTEQLLFSTFIGTDSWESGRSIACDSDGYSYITGSTTSGSFPTTTGAYDTTFNGSSDAFVAKFSTNGSKLIWSTFIGGTAQDWGETITLDSNGDLIVSGNTRSTDFPTTQGCYDNTSNGDDDLFVLKLDANGSLIKFATYIGGSDSDYGEHVLDADDNIYISGTTYSSDFPTTKDAYDRTQNGGSNDLYVTKLKANGSALDYSTYVGGGKEEYSHCPPVVDGNKNVYVTGYSSSTDFPMVNGCYNTSFNAQYDAVVFKLNANGTNLTASTFIGGMYYDHGMTIDINPNGRVVVTGTSTSPDYPVMTGDFDTSHNGYFDITITMFDDDLVDMIHSTFVGGGHEDYTLDIAMDANGTIYMTGFTQSTNFPIKGDCYDNTHNDYRDIHITRMSADLKTLINSTYLGGVWEDKGISIALDAANDIYITGHAYWSDFPSTSGSYDTTHNGRTDVVVLKFRFPEDPNKYLDNDNDGVMNWVDAFPDNPFEYHDTDGDGMGDNLDPDADGDGVNDEKDAFPLNSTETTDTDRDGLGNNVDTDDDNDGVNDTLDAFPLNPSEILDSDGDGIGDNLDPDDDNDNITDEQELMDAIGRQFTNVSTSIDLLRTFLEDELEDVNTSLQDSIDVLGNGFIQELMTVNASLADDIQTALDRIAGDIGALDASITTDIDDLGTWLSQVTMVLGNELASVNASLHANIDSLEGDVAGFYEALDDDLGQLSTVLVSVKGNLSSENKDIIEDIEALSELVSNMDEHSLSDLRDRLVDLATNLSGFDQDASARLMGIADNISTLKASASEDLETALENLQKLNTVLADLEQLDQDLSKAQQALDETVEDTSSEEMAKLNLNLGLLMVVIILVIVVLFLLQKTRRLESQPLTDREDENIGV